MKTKIGKLLNFFVWLCFAVAFLWAFGAIRHCPLLPTPLAFWVAILYTVAASVVLFRVRPTGKSRAFVSVSFILLYAILLIERPTNEREWASDQAKVAKIEIDDDLVKIKNFRHCIYRSESDFDARFFDVEFPLSSIQSVWFIVQKFTAAEGIAHVFLSFELTAGSKPEFVCVSVEIRREKGEFYDPVRGLYRNYELTHVVGDERDMIGVRTVHRPDDRVYLYRVNATPEQAKSLFTEFTNRIDSLNESPQFYNSLLNNCANGITGLTYDLTPEPIHWFDPRIILPGYSGEFAFANGLVGSRNNGQTFEELNAKARIDIRARENGINDSFSTAIRSRIE